MGASPPSLVPSDFRLVEASAHQLPIGTLTCGSRIVSYALRASSRARWMRLEVSPATGLLVTVPARHTPRELVRFLIRHQAWILRQVDRLETTVSHLPKRWPCGATLPYRGEEHVVRIQAADAPSITRTSECVLVVCMRQPGLEGARRLLRRWYASEALHWAIRHATSLGERLRVSWRRIRIGAAQHRWGSCSARGSLCFNYRLVMAPPAVMEYVVAHELCHRVEFNHSARFWELVAQHCPGYRDALSWLKTDGPHLGL